MNGKLYLVPVVIGELSAAMSIPAGVSAIINKLKYFIVEDPKGARKALRQSGFQGEFDDIDMQVLNEHTSMYDLDSLLLPLKNGQDVGLVSDAGCPSVADPGPALVQLAYKEGISVQALTGPSSVILGLMSSGFNGQHFTFQGYLPKDKAERQKKLIAMERSANNGITQIFIEAPYRNNKMVEELLFSLDQGTKFCVACDLTAPSEEVVVGTVAEWHKLKPDFDKRPAIFLIGK